MCIKRWLKPLTDCDPEAFLPDVIIEEELEAQQTEDVIKDK